MTTADRMEVLRTEISGRRIQDRSEPGRTSRAGRSGEGSLGAELGDRRRLEVMERKGQIKLGSGSIPRKFWDMPRPDDPRGRTSEALLDDRDEGY